MDGAYPVRRRTYVEAQVTCSDRAIDEVWEAPSGANRAGPRVPGWLPAWRSFNALHVGKRVWKERSLHERPDFLDLERRREEW